MPAQSAISVTLFYLIVLKPKTVASGMVLVNRSAARVVI